ncbi:MAG TPA: SRPBCC family protein [Miltoncostaeaceae bacterium]|nr:SRPBCC family protein [Miltoncostaeaceae bacterium]
MLKQIDPTERPAGEAAPAMPRGGGAPRREEGRLPRIDAHGGETLAKGLGWFSIGLGVAQLVAPARLCRAIGIEDDGEATTLMRLVGVREVVAGVGLLASNNPAPWMWARVAGDAMDLSLLGVAMTDDDAQRGRVGAAMGVVGAITALDVVTATALGEGAAGRGASMHVTKAVTVRRPVEEVYGFWHDFENLPRFMTHLESVSADGERSHWVAKAPVGTVEWDAEVVEDRPNELIAWRSLPGARVENAGRVTFRPAPADQGTEVRVEMDANVPAGPLGAMVAKMFGEDPSVQVGDDLRRFKQVLEAGEVVRSEGTPEGARARRHLNQRPAQPLPAGE